MRIRADAAEGELDRVGLAGNRGQRSAQRA